MLAWNREAAGPIDHEEAFELFERNCRHVDSEHLTTDETELIEKLIEESGHSHRMFA